MRHISPINKFDFQHWEEAPALLAMEKKENLTKEENHILSAVKLAYYSHEAGRKEINKKVERISLMGLMSLISLITLLSLATRFDKENITGTVNAATVSATFRKIQQGDGLEIIESTMSAMFSKEEK